MCTICHELSCRYAAYMAAYWHVEQQDLRTREPNSVLHVAPVSARVL